MNTNNSSPQTSFFASKWTVRHFLTRRALPAFSVLILVGMVAALFYPAPGVAEQAASPSEGKPLPVETTIVRYQSTYELNRQFTGQIAARRSSDLSFEASGKVIKLLVDQGNHVEAGQLLAQLDDRHLRARIAQVTAQHAQQSALLKELIEGPRKEAIAAARAEVKQLSAELALQQANLKRRKQLYEQNATSKESLDNVQFGFEAAEGRLEGARSRLEELETGTRAEQIEAQKAVVAQLDAQLRDLEHDEEDTQLRAPFAGSISNRMVDEGTVISTGTTIFNLVEDQHLEAWFGIPAPLAQRLKPGETRPVEVNAQQYEASVERILPELDPTTRSVTVIFQFAPQLSGRLIPGQVARLGLAIERQGDGAWIPNASLMRGSRGLWAVYVVEDRDSDAPTIVRRDVEVLASHSTHSFVRGTITEGDLVVASGVNRIVPGNRVEVVSTTNQSN